MTLTERVTRALLLAGIDPADPALQVIRDWNRAVALRAELRAAGYRQA